MSKSEADLSIHPAPLLRFVRTLAGCPQNVIPCLPVRTKPMTKDYRQFPTTYRHAAKAAQSTASAGAGNQFRWIASGQVKSGLDMERDVLSSGIEQFEVARGRPLVQMAERLAVRVGSLLVFALFFATAACVLCLTLPLRLVSRRFVRDSRFMHRFCSRIMYAFLRINPYWSCNFSGLQNLENRGPCVLVANHQSVADILVLSGLPCSFKWVAKSSIFQIPIVACFMRMNGYVCLPGNALHHTRALMKDCVQCLRRGDSILIFPEGTRSADGQIQAFKGGAFYLAAEANVPIVPIVVAGTGDILPKHSRDLCFCGSIDVQVLPAVSPADLAGDHKVLSARVRAEMARTLSRMRSRRSSLDSAA